MNFLLPLALVVIVALIILGALAIYGPPSSDVPVVPTEPVDAVDEVDPTEAARYSLGRVGV